MTKEKFKIIKDFGNPKKSERRKYLETMMAQMGLTSLDELYSDEERKRWIKAVTPQPIVEEKLKEMGYSMFSNTNKPSLGSSERSFDIHRLHKVANISVATERLTQSMQTIRAKLNPDTLYEIMGIMSEDRLQDKNFDSSTMQSEIETLVAENEEDLGFFEFLIQDLVQKASKYNSEYLKSTEAFSAQDAASIMEDMLSDSNLSVARRHSDHSQVAIIQQKLEDLNYKLEDYGVDGKFGPETEDAVILFQLEHDLNTTGVIDFNAFNTLMTTTVASLAVGKAVGEGAKRLLDGSAITLEGLSNVKFVYKDKANISKATPMLHEYLKILNEVASSAGGTIEITSAFRDSYNQARIMLNNYNSRKAGSRRANKYLSRLYRRLPRIDEIVNIYSGPLSKEEKIRAAENIIETSWPKSGHRGGKSIDVRLGRKVKNILKRTQDLATVDILRESDHFHVTIKSLNPALAGSRIRRFRG